VLYNADSKDGLAIAEYYAQVHPGVELLPLYGVSTDEQVSADHYLKVIRPQVLAGLNGKTSVIVTTKGLPLRISNTIPNPGTYPGWRGDAYNMAIPNDWWKPFSSLESELTRITRISTPEQMADQGFFLSPPTFNFPNDHQAHNPYHGSTVTFDRSNSANEGIYLTSRLDGFTVEDITKSIKRAQNAYIKPDHQLVVVDDDPYAAGTYADRMDQLVNQVLKPAGQKYLYDQTTAKLTTAPGPVIGYVSHGSQPNDPYYMDRLDFNLAAGAVMHTWESFNAYSFIKGNNRYGQGLIGEWLAMGGTAALGHVQEPKATHSSVADETILFDRLLKGFTFAEAAWAATEQLSFVNTVVGDPLMTYKRWVVGDANYDGVVNLTDLNRVLTNWNKYVDPSNALQGDVTGDGFVGFQDLTLVLNNWNTTAPPTGTARSIPEPGAATLCLPALGILLKRRTL
jgi:uncharacterized protein (TIGR03790 family)